MPRKKNPNLTFVNSEGKEKYNSQYARHDLYDKFQTERVVVRVPKGANELIQRFQKNHKEEYSSVNAMVNKLLETELKRDFGEDFSFKGYLKIAPDEAAKEYSSEDYDKIKEHRKRLTEDRKKTQEEKDSL